MYDWETARVLAPGVALLVLALVAWWQSERRDRRGWHHSAQAWSASFTALLVAFLLWSSIVFTVKDYQCDWEGFADGPLPVECRR